MGWVQIPCSGCNTAALLSGTSYAALEQQGFIRDGVVVRHLDSCHALAAEVVRLRLQVADRTRERTLTAILSMVALAGCAYLSGARVEAEQNAERWHQQTDPARTARDMIAAQNEIAASVMTEFNAAMRVYESTMGRIDVVMDVFEAEHDRIVMAAARSKTVPAQADPDPGPRAIAAAVADFGD